ncbi:MAG: IS110 family transposase [Oscillospiraceae bacterium]|jgi:Transposase and inactivated derivatives|nr:IS110 family transposase [Oscillospiraceae bacterium]
MNYTTVYVGMDVHKESFTLCCYTNEKEKTEYPQKVNGHYSKVLNYINAMRKHYGDDAVFVCGYEAGCLGFTLYHQLTEHNVDCVILAPTTMPQPQGKKKVKTDKRDAMLIARCLAHKDYSPVHIPTDIDEQVKEYVRMRDDHKLALKKVKQQIIAFCLRHDYRYTEGKSNWTEKHLQWLRSLESNGVYAEILEEYLLTYEYLTSKLEMLESRIKELAELDEYKESVQKLRCFIGIDTITALSLVVEVGDFHRFATAGHFMSYIGLTPGEDSSGQDQNRLGITKAGNRHLRKLLSESSQCFSRGKVGAKSVALKKRQQGNPPAVIEYADKANIRLKKRFYHLVLNKGKHRNVAIIAVSRELAGFIWGMMTEQFV